jgi:hypothetical protein
MVARRFPTASSSDASRAFASAFALVLASACGWIAGLDGKTFEGGFYAGNAGVNQGGSNGGLGGGGAGAPSSGGRAGMTSAGRGGETNGGSSVGGGSGEGGDAGTGGTAGSSGRCEDVTRALCMRPPWPDGVVPSAKPAGLPNFLSRVLDEAIESWEGMAVGSERLQFVEGSRPDVPTLVFSLERGCGPVRVTDEAVIVAFDSCVNQATAEPAAVMRAVGVALGLPRMHQRADRERYLQMARPEAFDCTRSELYDKCPDLGDIPAVLGPFDFSTLMAAPGVRFEECRTDNPTFPYLYIQRGNFPEPSYQCDAVSRDSTDTTHERGALAELYAISHGFRPAAVVGRDQGSTLPLSYELAPGVQAVGRPALVALGAQGMAAFVLGESSQADGLRREVFMIQTADGENWGERGSRCCWEALPLPPAPAFGELTASIRSGSRSTVDFIYRTAEFLGPVQVHHASYDVETARGTAWTELEPPFSSAATSPLLVASGSASTLLLHAYDADGNGAEPVEYETYAAEWDFESAPVWRPLPTLTSPERFETLLFRGGATREHLLASTAEKVRYASRVPGGVWSEWSALESFLATELARAAFVSTTNYEIAILSGGPGYFWFSGCAASPCNVSNAWTEPVVIELSFSDIPVVESVVSTDHHELATILTGDGYRWFAACGQAPCDDASAWSPPIAIGPRTTDAVALGRADRIDLLTRHFEDRPHLSFGIPGVVHKRWHPPPP